MVDRLITRWAEDAAVGDVADPGLGQELTGYTGDQTLPASELNYLLRQLLGGAGGLGTGAVGGFTALEEASAALAAGGVAIVNEYNPALAPGDPIWTYTNAGVTNTGDLAADGRFLYLVTTNVVLALNRSTADVEATLALTGATKVYSDGGRVFVAVSSGGVDTVVAYAPPVAGSWAAALWTSADLGDAIQAVYSDGGAVFVAQTPATGVTARRLHRDTGATVWSSTVHAVVLVDIVSDGDAVWVCGDPDTGVTVRRLNRETGAAVDAASASFANGTTGLCLVGKREAGAASAFAMPYIVVVGAVDTGVSAIAYDHALASVWTANPAPAGGARCVCFDGVSLWVGTDLGPAAQHIIELSSWSGALMRQIDINIPTVYAIASDGFGLFVGGDKPATTDEIAWRRHLVRPPVLVSKLAGTERWRWPWHIGILPADHPQGASAHED